MHFDLLDVIIAAVALSAAVGGFRLGFLARVASWIGLAVGLVLGARLLPTVITSLKSADPTGKLLVAALVLLGGAFLGQAAGLLIGWRVHGFLPLGPLRTVDDAVGAAVGVLGVLVAVWLLLPSMADVPGWSARQARNSSIARLVARDFPRPPDTLQALRRLVGNQAFPEVFNALAPSVNTGPPPAASPLAGTLAAQVVQSTVKVEGEACGEIQEGSGWTVGTDTVVTNAHVVAGERHTQVLTPGGRVLAATVEGFDESRDLAVLAVPGLGEKALPVAPSASGSGTTGDVFGHPGGQDRVAITPFLVNERVQAIGRDLYDQHDTRRDVYILASGLMPGDSGGPLVTPAGVVVGVAFAIAPDRPGTSYALAATEVNAFLAAGVRGPVSTGPCLTEG